MQFGCVRRQPQWVEELTPAQQVALEPPYLYNRLGVENDGETVTIDSSNGQCGSSLFLLPGGVKWADRSGSGRRCVFWAAVRASLARAGRGSDPAALGHGGGRHGARGPGGPRRLAGHGLDVGAGPRRWEEVSGTGRKGQKLLVPARRKQV